MIPPATTTSTAQLPHPDYIRARVAGTQKSADPRSTQYRASRALQRDVVMRAIAGDESAFAELYRVHSRKVYWLCVRMTHDHAQAEDLTQETFLQVFRRLRTFRGDAAFSTWLHIVAVNVVLMHLRKCKHGDTSLDEVLDDNHNGDHAPRELQSIDNQLAKSVDRVALERAIAALAPGYRLCFWLHDVEGYEHHEIAEILKIKEGSSKSQLHKARMRLRSLLQAG